MLTQSLSAGEPTPTMAGPCWDRIDENVFCPLCDYNLRGLIEPRCPECGFKFAWPDLLDPARRKHPYLFEHHPERNIWSAWKTFCAMWRPKDFWTSLHPAQPSSPRRLILYWLIGVGVLLAVCLSTGAWLTVVRAREWATQIAMTRVSQAAYFSSHAGQAEAKKAISRYGSIQAFLNTHYSTSPQYVQAARTTLRAYVDVSPLLIVIGIHPWLTALGLYVLAIPVRNKMGGAHLMRIAIYSMDTVPLLVILCACISAIGFTFLGPRIIVSVIASLVVLAEIVFSYRMTLAFTHYLHFDSALTRILASRIMVDLASLIVLLLLFFLYVEN